VMRLANLTSVREKKNPIVVKNHLLAEVQVERFMKDGNSALISSFIQESRSEHI